MEAVQSYKVKYIYRFPSHTVCRDHLNVYFMPCSPCICPQWKLHPSKPSSRTNIIAFNEIFSIAHTPVSMPSVRTALQYKCNSISSIHLTSGICTPAYRAQNLGTYTSLWGLHSISNNSLPRIHGIHVTNEICTPAHSGYSQVSMSPINTAFQQTSFPWYSCHLCCICAKHSSIHISLPRIKNPSECNVK